MHDLVLPERVRRALGRDHARLRRAVADAGGTPFRRGDTVTLLYIGVADRVEVRHWLDIFPELPELVRLESDDVWATTFPMPADARIEYKFAITRHGRHRLALDALNPVQSPGPMGSNSVLRGSGYEPPEWTQLRSGGPAGSVTRHEIRSTVFGDERILHLYRPADAEPEALLVAHDGSDYLDYAGFARVLDNLIDDGVLAPVAAAFVDPVDRMAEYRASSRHADFLADEVVPFAAAETGTIRAIAAGASLGGVASLHASWRHPGLFDGLILQAGSFVTELGPYGRGQVFMPVIRFLRGYEAAPGPVPNRVHVSCGRYDGLIGDARRMARRFADRGADVGYADNAAGHDWAGWRDLLRAALLHVVGREGFSP